MTSGLQPGTFTPSFGWLSRTGLSEKLTTVRRSPYMPPPSLLVLLLVTGPLLSVRLASLPMTIPPPCPPIGPLARF
jgi:hypothetical protein